jgi:putative sigma-54 modulation protein
MKIDYTCRNFSLDDRLRSYIESKTKKVWKLLEEPIEVRVTLEVEKHRFHVELHATHRLGVLHVKAHTDSSMREAVDLAVDKVEAQAGRTHQKLVDRRRHPDRVGGGVARAARAARSNGRGLRWPVAVLERASVGEGREPRIILSTHLEIKPMTIDEAALELESSDNLFVLFRDAASDRLNVLYRRKDNNYGLIAPDEG